VAHSTARGHKTVFDYTKEAWLYSDTKTPINDAEGIVRPCKRCGEPPTPEGHDACLGHIEGAVSACCGHGVSEPILMTREDEALFDKKHGFSGKDD
jgi:hypothetical protein